MHVPILWLRTGQPPPRPLFAKQTGRKTCGIYVIGKRSAYAGQLHTSNIFNNGTGGYSAGPRHLPFAQLKPKSTVAALLSSCAWITSSAGIISPCGVRQGFTMTYAQDYYPGRTQYFPQGFFRPSMIIPNTHSDHFAKVFAFNRNTCSLLIVTGVRNLSEYKIKARSSFRIQFLKKRQRITQDSLPVRNSYI
jgi:hypothetical protein